MNLNKLALQRCLTLIGRTTEVRSGLEVALFRLRDLSEAMAWKLLHCTQT